MDKKQYFYGGDYVTIWGEVADKPDMVIVTQSNDCGDLMVVRKSDLIPKEESYVFKQAQKRAEELRLITARAEERLNEVVEEVIEKAVNSLSYRMKMNAVFGKDIGNVGGWAIQVSNELEKLIKEKAPEVVKKKDDIFG